MELVFKTEKKKKGIRYLSFLPKKIRSIGAISIVVNFIILLVTIIFYNGLQKNIPLFYSMPNDQQLVRKEFIFVLPVIATLVNSLHLFIAYIEKEIDYNILRMFLQVTLLLQVLVLAILLRVIIIVY